MCPQAQLVLEIQCWAKLTGFMILVGRETLIKVTHKYVINCVHFTTHNGVGRHWAGLSEKVDLRSCLSWARKQLAGLGCGISWNELLLQALSISVSIIYLRNCKASVWDRGNERKKMASELRNWPRKNDLLLLWEVQCGGVCHFGPDREDMVGVAHYLVTISSSSLPWRVITQIFFFFLAQSCAFLLFCYFKQNTDFFHHKIVEQGPCPKKKKKKL